MAVTTDIFASYVRPRQVFGRILSRGVTEAQAFVFLLVAMLLGFVSQLPYASRRANTSDPELEAALRADAADVRQIEALQVPQNMVDAKFEFFLSSEVTIWFFLLPLFFYAVAGLSYLVLRGLGRSFQGVELRMALFWALLVVTPLKLLHGLFLGFVGEGPMLTIVGFAWFAALIWVWFSNLREVGWSDAT